MWLLGQIQYTRKTKAGHELLHPIQLMWQARFHSGDSDYFWDSVLQIEAMYTVPVTCLSNLRKKYSWVNLGRNEIRPKYPPWSPLSPPSWGGEGRPADPVSYRGKNPGSPLSRPFILFLENHSSNLPPPPPPPLNHQHSPHPPSTTSTFWTAGGWRRERGELLYNNKLICEKSQ